MKLTRTGALFHWVLFGLFAALLFFAINILPEQPRSFPGELSFELIAASQRTEDMLSFVEQAAVLAAEKTLPPLALRGGFPTKSPCGTLYGQGDGASSIHFWNKQDFFCFPEHEQHITDGLNSQINPFLAAYPKSFVREDTTIISVMPKLTFSFFFEHTQLSGFSSDAIQTTLIKEGRILARHAVQPSFAVSLPYDNGEYSPLFGEAQELVFGCRDEADAASLLACVESGMGEGWKIGSCAKEATEEEKQKHAADLQFPFCVKRTMSHQFALDFTKVDQTSNIV